MPYHGDYSLHYSELKVFALTTPGVENACCGQCGDAAATYRLRSVSGQEQRSRHLIEAGLPDYIIEDAKTNLEAKG